MSEVKRWYWSGHLCRYEDGYLIERMEHSPFRSDPSPAVVLASDYDALAAELAVVRAAVPLADDKSIDALLLELGMIGVSVPGRDYAFFRAAVNKWLNDSFSAAVVKIGSTAVQPKAARPDVLPLLTAALDAVELLHYIRCHPKRHDLDRDWLTKADRVIGYWDATNTKTLIRNAITMIERATDQTTGVP